MQHKKRIRFIVNPFSGLGKQKTFKALAAQELDKSIWSWEVVFTKYPGHATILSTEAVGHFDIVVAVGGDGTINEVGSGIIGTDVIMGIIPAGSGNGLARHLNIPLKVNRALQMFNQYNVQPIDAIRFHNKYSLNVSGVGFDGHISHLFAHAKQRGPLGYLRLITTEFSKYKSKNYRLVIDGVPYEREAFLISFANSSQYGNNVHIAPGAKIDDGWIDVCIIRDFPKLEAPALLLSLFDRTIDQSKYDEIILGRHITIESDEPLMPHVDGEPLEHNGSLNIEMIPLAIKMMVPNDEFLRNPVIAQLQDLMPDFSSLTKFKI
jgi:YegS/Rv2252/BmrU family lipid kinase